MSTAQWCFLAILAAILLGSVASLIFEARHAVWVDEDEVPIDPTLVDAAKWFRKHGVRP
jgi:hypothetical protein